MQTNPPAVSESVPMIPPMHCDYCGDSVIAGEGNIARCAQCWDHHFNLLDPVYRANNPEPPHIAIRKQLTTLQQALDAKTRECEELNRRYDEKWAHELNKAHGV